MVTRLIPGLPTWMTIEAVPSDVEDTMIGMVLFCFGLVMTSVTVYCGVRPLVAARTIAACPAVVHRESMALDIDRAPVAGVMALGALTFPVVSWRSVTRRAIRLTRVVEIGGRPGIGVMAGRTLPAVMVGWLIFGVS
jgi:hypothetical protein